MTRTEEFSLLLRVEYGFYNQYRRWYQEGKLTRKDAIRKLNTEYQAILHAKQDCKLELPEEEYPQEYFWDDPLRAEQLLPPEPACLSKAAASENHPYMHKPTHEKTTVLKKQDHFRNVTKMVSHPKTAVLKKPAAMDANSDGVQLSIFDIFGDEI